MSQQINLINPALRLRRDWLAFNSVAPAALATLVLTASFYAYARHQAGELQRQQTALAAELTAAQDELKATQGVFTSRKPDSGLVEEAQSLMDKTAQRKETLRLAEESATAGGTALTEVMRGFSRQLVEGVWLTGFSVGPAGIDIRGRLLNSAALPTYIRHLNAEPAFRGRRFAALNMEEAKPQTPAGTAAATESESAKAQPRYTEFTLRASLAAPQPAGGKE